MVFEPLEVYNKNGIKGTAAGQMVMASPNLYPTWKCKMSPGNVLQVLPSTE